MCVCVCECTLVFVCKSVSATIAWNVIAVVDTSCTVCCWDYVAALSIIAFCRIISSCVSMIDSAKRYVTVQFNRVVSRLLPPPRRLRLGLGLFTGWFVCLSADYSRRYRWMWTFQKGYALAWLVGGNPFYLKFWVKVTALVQNLNN